MYNRKKRYIKSIVLFLLLIPLIGTAQNALTVRIQNEKDSFPVQRATLNIKGLKITLSANDAGLINLELPNAVYTFVVTAAGYKELESRITLSNLPNDTIKLLLQRDDQVLDELTISSTRSNRSFRNTATRVEVLAPEEINEEASMRPGDIRMMLAESTGIQTQQTSAVTGNAAIRIQGLDGRYTQILKDGFPIYSGAASGLGLLQTPPLDLKQVEIIKGSSSTLYGGGAVAGLVNLISKTPGTKRELNFLVNATSAGGLDINGFYSRRFRRTGLTLYAARNSNKAYDPSGIGFTAIPKFDRYTLNPKFFVYFSSKTKLSFGINTSFENRIGGDMKLITGNGDSVHSFFERNITQRLSTQLTFDYKIDEKSSIKVKNSASIYKRRISSKGYYFDGTQVSTFTETAYSFQHGAGDFVAGINILGDDFREPAASVPVPRNYQQNTVGAFLQDTWNAVSWLIVETGIRGDHVEGYGGVLLPRVSTVLKFTPNFTSRIGVGWGYKPPTIFTEETERLLYKNVLPVSRSRNLLEKSIGVNLDLDYKFSQDELNFSVNQFFFYTKLRNPLVLGRDLNGNYQLNNLIGIIRSKGAETNIKLGYGKLALYLGYTYTDSKQLDSGLSKQTPLTPKHRMNAALVYELEGKWKFGSELYFFSHQELGDGNIGRGYWLSGLIAEKLWKRISLFINFENFSDVRQTRFENIYSGTVTNPVFKEIYAPLEGFVFNGGIKLKL